EGEGFPLALQEALVTGIPCVVTPGPGYDHYLREGEAVLVARDPAAIREVLTRLAHDEHERSELAARAQAAGAREFGVPRLGWAAIGSQPVQETYHMRQRPFSRST